MSILEELMKRAPFTELRRSTTYGPDGQVRSWSETTGPERKPFERIPDSRIARRSALLDAEGNIVQQWVIEKPEDALREAAWTEFAKALAMDVPRVSPIPAPSHGLASELLAAYPVGDHHMGMLAWKHEVGVSYDLDIGECLLKGAFEHLLSATPPAEHAIVPFLGDFLHYDSHVAQTPGHGNPLDADGRYAKMISAASRTMRYCIEATLARHGRVHVIVEIGNHDIVGSAWAAELMRACYENEPRITVEIAPGHYHYYRFHENLIGVHHGNETKLEKLGEVMAADRPADWGETSHRYWWTGHVHHQRTIDGKGWSAESFRILPGPDAWAYNAGFRSTRDMKAIVLHAKHGEVARYTVNPSMLDSAR